MSTLRTRSLAAWAVRRPVATGAAVLALVLLGSVSLGRLPVALLPDVSVPVLTIRTRLPGAPASDVAQLVASPIEEAVSATPGLMDMRSVSRDGEVTTTVRFAWGTDMRTSMLTVRERLDAARDGLPAEAERPTLLASDPGAQPIAVLAVAMRATSRAGWSTDSGTVVEERLRALAHTVSGVHQRRLEQLPGVSSVAVVGAPVEELRVTVDAARLRTLGLTVPDIAQALRAQNGADVGGLVRRGTLQLPLRTLNAFRDVDAVHDAPIPPFGSGRTLRDVGTVRRALAAARAVARLDGMPALGLVVYKDPGANTVAVTQQLHTVLAQLTQEFPEVRLTPIVLQAGFIEDALTNLGQEIALGSVLSWLVILLFLRSWRLAFAIVLIVPLSVLASLVVLQQLDVSINVLSLGGLALGTGLLVDTAIVVVEAVGRRRHATWSPARAAILGTTEVTAPLVVGTVTTVLVFGPVLFVRGLAAALFRDLSLSVVVTVLMSLLLSLTLLPVLLAERRPAFHRRRRASSGPSRVGRWLDVAGQHGAVWYEHGVRWALRHPWGIAGGVLLLVGITGVAWHQVPREILPQVDARVITAQLQLPPGTRLDATVAVAARVEMAARAAGASAIFTRAGAAMSDEIVAGADPGSPASATLMIPVPPHTDAAILAQRVRDAVPDLARGALAFDLAGASEFGALIGREGRTVRVDLTAATDSAAQAWADTVQRELRTLPLVRDVRPVAVGMQPLILVSLDRAQLAQRGLVPEDVAQALTGALGGLPAGDLRATDHRTPIVVRAGPSAHEHLDSALATVVHGVPLRALVQVQAVRAPREVLRIAQQPVREIEALAERGGTAQVTDAVASALARRTFPPDVHWQLAGADVERRRTMEELVQVAGLAVALMYLVLAGEFASLRLPLVVMLTVPLAAAGGVLALWATGQSLNAVSLIGLVMMIGMADNEAVVKLHAIRSAQAQGTSMARAILRGGHQRLRAIAMTAITTITGVIPLLGSWGRGGALYRPLAAAIIGGTLGALIVTWLVLPVAYALAMSHRRPRSASGPRAAAT